MAQARPALPVPPASERAASERVAREDLVLFINACFACTGQSEFYGDAAGQGISIRFLHEYILGNYRRLYARTLAAGINHYNRALIVKNLLAAGAPAEPAERVEEGELILATLLALPAPRAYQLLREVRSRRVNNRRTRAVIREFLGRRPDRAFDAVKYRVHVRAVAAHAHLRLPGEVGRFVFEGVSRKGAYATPLFESFRRAHYSQESLYELPYTIAVGLAKKHGVPQDKFLTRIAPRMTFLERLTLQGAAERAEAAPIAIDLTRAPLTKLCSYLLSLPEDERRARQPELLAALRGAAERALRRTPLRLGRVAAVLDRSYSTSGSSEKRRRPLAVALAVSQLLRAASRQYTAVWTTPLPEPAQASAAAVTERSRLPAEGVAEPAQAPVAEATTLARAPVDAAAELLVSPRGPTRLAAPLLDALGHAPEVVIIVSDGYENDPPGMASELIRLYRAHLDPQRRVSFVHVNPVFDSERFAPRGLGDALPTIGLRDAEDLLTGIGFARFADGAAPLAELEAYLAARVPLLLRRLRTTPPAASALDSAAPLDALDPAGALDATDAEPDAATSTDAAPVELDGPINDTSAESALASAAARVVEARLAK